MKQGIQPWHSWQSLFWGSQQHQRPQSACSLLLGTLPQNVGQACAEHVDMLTFLHCNYILL